MCAYTCHRWPERELRAYVAPLGSTLSEDEKGDERKNDCARECDETNKPSGLVEGLLVVILYVGASDRVVRVRGIVVRRLE